MKYSTKEFAVASGVPWGTLRRWAMEGRLIPVERRGKKGNFYDESQIAEAQSLYLEKRPNAKLHLADVAQKENVDDTATSAQAPAQATEMPADEQTPAADEIANVAPVIADTPAHVDEFGSDNQSADVPVDGEKNSPANTDEQKDMYCENNSEADNITSAAEIQPVSPTVDIEKFALINKISAGTLAAYGFITVTKYSNKNRGNPARFKCPFCGSHELTPYNGGSFLQWRCDCFGDDFKRNEDLLAKTFGLDVNADKAEIYRRVKEKMPDFDKPTESMIKPNVNVGLFADDTPAENNPTTNGDISIEQQIIDDLEISSGGFEDLPVEEKRGIRDETARRLKIGATKSWYHPKMPNTPSTTRFICRLGDDTDPPSYNAILTPAERRRVKPLRERYEKQGKKPPKWTDKSLTAGSKLIFNPTAINDNDGLLCVTEGEFDCVSIVQATNFQVAACALGGAGQDKRFVERLSKLNNPPKVIVLFDRDTESQTGQLEAPKLVAELTEKRVPAVAKFFEDVMSDDELKIFGGKVDANEILQKRGDEFLADVINRIIDSSRSDLDKAKDKITREAIFSTKPVNQSTNKVKAQLDNQSAVGGTVQAKKPAPVVTAETVNIARAALDAIPVTQCSEPEWTKIIWAGRASGLTLEELDSWSREDSRYDSAAVKNRWGRYRADEGWTVKFLIETAKRFGFNETTAQIFSLKTKLNEVDKEIADLDKEATAALEKLRDVEKFDSETVFADEIITAAAFARLTNKQAFSDFRREVKIYGDKNKAEKVNVTSWLSDVKDRADEISKRRKSLETKRNIVQAQINSLSFVGKNKLLDGITIPAEYDITAERGIEKVTEKKVVTVCRRPIVVAEKIYSVDEKISKLVLAFMTTAGTWKKIPPTEKAIVFNRNRIIDLANSDLPVTSSNAALVVEYLDAFNTQNESKLPMSYFVNRGGWRSFNGKDFFIDPRRETILDANGKKISVKVDTSRNEFAQHLKTVGSLDEWKKAYLLAKKAPVARLMVAAAVAPPLLKILGERNFLLYVYAPTRAGKTTALYLGTSAVGGKKINRSFDATKNGLAGAAAYVNDYCFPVDEKQVADNRISEQLTALVYALGNGVGRTKLNRDSTLNEAKDWRTIAIATGETLLLPDNVTGGANTRLLTVKAPKEILSPADCKVISETIKENYGLAFPLVVEKILKTDRQKLRGMFDQMSAVFEAKYPEILPDHRRYMALLTLADAILNAALFGNEVTTPDGESILPSDDAIINAAKIFPLILTIAEISDTPREKDFVRSFIGQNQNHFVGGLMDIDRMQAIYGKLKDYDGFIYVSAKALKDACKAEGFDYRKLVADLVADGFFKPADTLEKNHKTPLATVQKKIGATNMRCHRIPQVEFDDC